MVRSYSITACTLAPGLLPADGGESFPGIAHGLVSLHEAFGTRANTGA